MHIHNQSSLRRTYFKKRVPYRYISVPPLLYFLQIFTLPASVQNDADPDQNFHVDADPDPDPDWHQNDADPHAVPTLSFKHVAKSDFFYF